MTVGQLSTELSIVAKRLEEAANSHADLTKVFQQRASWLIEQLDEDARSPSMLRVWGNAKNEDEVAKSSIVHPAILMWLSKRLHVSWNEESINAGIQHSYGYLFSLLMTPYGMKRDRWIFDTLDRGLGFHSPIVRARPSSGTLLSNVTVLFARIALRDSPAALHLLKRVRKLVSPEILKYSIDTLMVHRITERFRARTTAGRFRGVELRTDLVQFPYPTGRTDSHLLIYSLIDTEVDRLPRLITGFTIRPDTFAELTDCNLLGSHVEIRTRYNAHLPGIARIHWGRRECRELL